MDQFYVEIEEHANGRNDGRTDVRMYGRKDIWTSRHSIDQVLILDYLKYKKNFETSLDFNYVKPCLDLVQL